MWKKMGKIFWPCRTESERAAKTLDNMLDWKKSWSLSVTACRDVGGFMDANTFSHLAILAAELNVCPSGFWHCSGAKDVSLYIL